MSLDSLLPTTYQKPPRFARRGGELEHATVANRSGALCDTRFHIALARAAYDFLCRCPSRDGSATTCAGGFFPHEVIRYNRGSFPGLKAEELFRDEFAPVASPHLGLREPGDLRRQTLIHFEWYRTDRETPIWPSPRS